ncbi:MAG TPA: ABC transporter permease, partial [Tepidiformaceae bacterium]
LALFGVLLALAALLWPAYRATSHSIVHYKQHLARPPQQPMFLRYYLDLVLVGVGAYAFYQLRQRGSLVTDRLFGDLSADPLLLVAPTLFMLIIALVFLRLFPIALRAASWLGRGLNGPTIPLGLWHMVRSPLHYSRLILLLLLATAVGMFAAGFRATLERSYDDRASYEAGAPVRLAGVSAPVNLPAKPYAARIGAATGAETVIPVARLESSYSDSAFRYQSITILGVVPEQFDEVAYWRDDFASRSLGDLMETLEEPLEEAEPGPEIPTDGRYIGLWAKLELPRNMAGPGVRLRDAEGGLWEYRLGPAGEPRPDGWQFFAADLARPVQQRVVKDRSPLDSGSLRLDSVYIRFGGNPQTPQRVTILVDELQVGDSPTAEGLSEARVIEGFENLNLYETIAGTSPNTEPAQLSRAEGDARGGQFAARLLFTREPAGATLIGLQVTGAAQTIPVLASTSFFDYSDKKIGDEVLLYINRQYVSARLAGSFRYFPTYEPVEGRHLVVASLESLQVVAARVPYLSDGIYPNEAWVSCPGPLTLDREALSSAGVAASSIFDRDAIREQKGSDPLIAASWEGILFLSFASVLLLTGLGLIVYTYLTAQSRSLEFAILRTMGFSGKQILALVSFEQLFVIIAGIGAGTLLGMPLGRLMVGYIGFDESGGEVLPPLLSRISWGTVATVYGLLGLVFLGTILSLVLMYSRLALHRALRMGEL